ncbi:uncharacterized protein LOC116160650 [Photinus pyralis]|uniref:uncharacterized protein LOC116160650 n=1 Tax=Photinus pyralis TaxID=7054 RepID=UPI0012674386|nr:uncharacterized protein LOC116160650 [Photinus pyralis]
MYFKLVLASVVFLCIGFASGFTKNTCFQCFGTTDMYPQHIDNCRKFINITETSVCSPPGYCLFYVSTYQQHQQQITKVARVCDSHDCDFFKKGKEKFLHCSQCEGNYCNTDTY